MKTITAIALCLACSFWANASIAEEADRDGKAQAYVAKLSLKAFCQALGPTLRRRTQSTQELRAAMVDRALRDASITTPMLIGIRAQRPVLGMNHCALLAAIGLPIEQNRTVSQGGERVQLVYDNPRRYVYFVNGSLSAWQD